MGTLSSCYFPLVAIALLWSLLQPDWNFYLVLLYLCSSEGHVLETSITSVDFEGCLLAFKPQFPICKLGITVDLFIVWLRGCTHR